MAGDGSGSTEQGTQETLAGVGEDLSAAVGADLDEDVLTGAAEEMARGMNDIASLTADDLTPELEPQYKAVAGAGDEIVSHLVSQRFFEAVDEVAPPFDADLLEDCLVHALQVVGMNPSLYETGGVRTELSGVIRGTLDHVEEVEQNVRWEPDKPEKVSPMTTRGATEGAVYWLDDLGRHLWMSETLLSAEMVDDAAAHTQALGAALLMIGQGAAGLVGEMDAADAAALVVGGIALHTYHQRRIPEDLSWITDDMRAPGAWAGD